MAISPSPAQGVLGKHARVEAVEADKTTDSEVALRPTRKRARVDSMRMENPPVIFPQSGPSYTSTPKRSFSPLGFFTGGRRAPTPLARSSEEEDFESDSYLEDREEFVPGSSKHVLPEAGPSNAGYFSGSLPPFAMPAAPTVPTTPPCISVEMHGSPGLDAPWQPMGTPASPKPVYAPIYGPDSLQSPLAAPEPGFNFRGGWNERNDRYNPFSTPGMPHHTGLTPLLRPTLRSPAAVDGKETSGKLRTMYGTELDRDTRFGDGGNGPWRRQ